MKTFKSNNQKLLITSSSALAGIILVTTFAGCTRKDPDTSNDSTLNPTDTYNTAIDVTTDTTLDSSTNETYNFTWDDNASKEFDTYLNSRLHISITKYVLYYGFTDEFNQVFTDFCNKKYGLNCKSVPESKANYFLNYIHDKLYHNCNDDFEYFKLTKLDKEDINVGTFSNKLIMSYLVQNQIPLGSRVPLDNLKSIMGDEVYTYDQGLSEIIKDPKIGNYPADHKYTKGQLFDALKRYNFAVYYLCVDYSIKTGNPFDKIESFDKCNEHLRKVYGENAPQIGQKITPEQYEKIWGEPVLDISYIQGAVVQTPQETMASPISYIDYDNYNVYYNPNYNMTSEEERGRSR
ncbi:MAG: hypothetical protein IKX00_01415 [Bacilli bacterium]|nr:hypothetical protein [Bacilli bacterium]